MKSGLYHQPGGGGRWGKVRTWVRTEGGTAAGGWIATCVAGTKRHSARGGPRRAAGAAGSHVLSTTPNTITIVKIRSARPPSGTPSWAHPPCWPAPHPRGWAAHGCRGSGSSSGSPPAAQWGVGAGVWKCWLSICTRCCGARKRSRRARGRMAEFREAGSWREGQPLCPPWQQPGSAARVLPLRSRCWHGRCGRRGSRPPSGAALTSVTVISSSHLIMRPPM